MPRESVSYKNINGVLYYTSTYFAEQVFVSKRGARAFLEDFKSLDGHSNPKLYDEATMDKAIVAYQQGKKTKEIYEKKRLEILLEEERMRAGDEEDANRDFLLNQENLNEEILNNDEEYQIEAQVRLYAKKRFDNELPIMMLKHLLYIHGYEFDEMSYYKDLEFHELRESFRDLGDERTIEHLESVKRLESNHGYLIKK